MGPKWRAPKKNNLKAWNQVADGDIWWDKKALAKSDRIQRDLGFKDHWANFKRLVQKKPGGNL